MADELHCYRCGASLAALSLPLSRQDLCPACGVELHVCRMCSNFDTQVPGQCLEDDAEDVFEKERANFCDWFKPAAGVFDQQRHREEQRAKSQLAVLFGDGESGQPDDDAALRDAEDLFK